MPASPAIAFGVGGSRWLLGCSPAPKANRAVHRASPSRILHASPLTPHLDFDWARAGKKGKVSVFEG